MTTFIRQTIQLIALNVHHYLTVLPIHGKVKADAIRSREIDRILGIK